MTISPIQLVQRHLREATSLPVVSKVPSERPPRFVRVDQGVPQRLNLDQYETTIIVQVYDQTRAAAFHLISDLLVFLEMDLEHDDDVSSWEADGPVDFSDPDLPHLSRWQFTGQLITTLDY